MWNTLSNDTIDPNNPAYTEAHRRVLRRLGEYTATIIEPLKLRPTAAMLLRDNAQRVEVRISTPSNHVVLVIAPEGDLAPEVFWLRKLAASNLPIPRLLAHDLSNTSVPFSYALESYVGGAPLDWLDDEPRMRLLARQLGRTLRRSHQVDAPAFGRPSISGRWPTGAWTAALHHWLTCYETVARADETLGSELAAMLWAATLEHPALHYAKPCVLHGAVEPSRAIVTVGDSAQLEALTQPGELVGGDPMFDVAHGLLPRHPAAFRQGLLEGYVASFQLTNEQIERLHRLKLLLHVADTLRRGDETECATLVDDVATMLLELPS